VCELHIYVYVLCVLYTHALCVSFVSISLVPYIYRCRACELYVEIFCVLNVDILCVCVCVCVCVVVGGCVSSSQFKTVKLLYFMVFSYTLTLTTYLISGPAKCH
jgi:hypothetical protein